MLIQIKTVHCGDIQENAYIVYLEGQSECVVIDPGDEYMKLRRAIDRPVAAILLTHGHFDHIMAVGELVAATGATVYIGQADMEMLDNPRLNGYDTLMGPGHMPGQPFSAAPYGETLSVAGMNFEVLSTPGHSRGSVCLYLRSEDTLFSGDTLFKAGFGRMDLHGGSPAQMRDSLRRLFELPPATKVYCGHGAPTTIGEERSRYRL